MKSGELLRVRKRPQGFEKFTAFTGVSTSAFLPLFFPGPKLEIQFTSLICHTVWIKNSFHTVQNDFLSLTTLYDFHHPSASKINELRRGKITSPTCQGYMQVDF